MEEEIHGATRLISLNVGMIAMSVNGKLLLSFNKSIVGYTSIPILHLLWLPGYSVILRASHVIVD